MYINTNEILMSIALLNTLAAKLKNGIVALSEVEKKDYANRKKDFAEKIVYDESFPLGREVKWRSGKGFEIGNCFFIIKEVDSYDSDDRIYDDRIYYDKKSTGIEGTFALIVCSCDKDDEIYFEPYIEVTLKDYEDNPIIIKSGSWCV